MMAAHELKRCSAKLDLARERSFVRQQKLGPEFEGAHASLWPLTQLRDLNAVSPVCRPQCSILQGYQQGRDFGNRKKAAMSVRGKPTMEIYRPPNVRTDTVQNGAVPTNRLNVHAKEFTMKPTELTTSRSSMNLPTTLSSGNVHSHGNHRHSLYLQTSKSSGNILHSLQGSKSSGNVMHSLQQSNSNANIVQGPRVHFQLNTPEEPRASISSPKTNAPISDFPMKSPLKSYSVSEMKLTFPESKVVAVDAGENLTAGIRNVRLSPFGLKRSKSMGAAEMAAAKGGAPGFGIAKEAPELGNFPLDVVASIQKAVEDPNKVSTRTLMELVRIIMDRVLYGISYALPAAKLCITIIEKEKKETFLESLLNTCQQWYQERDRVLRSTGPSGTSNSRYCAFMHFVNEMYCELKRRQLQLKTQYEGIPPGLVLLNLLYKGCQDCVKPPTTEGDTDCLLFVLTTAGRDLDQELPQKLQQLLAKIRDTFLTATVTPLIKKTLLQLIELHASRWQLPASAVMYYTSPQYNRPSPS